MVENAVYEGNRCEVYYCLSLDYRDDELLLQLQRLAKEWIVG